MPHTSFSSQIWPCVIRSLDQLSAVHANGTAPRPRINACANGKVHRAKLSGNALLVGAAIARLGRASIDQSNDIFHRPEPIRDPSFHRWRDAQRPIDAAEVVPAEVRAESADVGVQLLAGEVGLSGASGSDPIDRNGRANHVAGALLSACAFRHWVAPTRRTAGGAYEPARSRSTMPR
jgi:hypothetical protein